MPSPAERRETASTQPGHGPAPGRSLVARLPPALAIGLGLSAANEAYAGRLRAAQIAAIVRLTPLTMGASCLNAVILLTTLGRMGRIGWPLLIWSIALFGVVLRNGLKWWAGRSREPNRAVSDRAIRRAVLQGGLFGVLWGVVPVLTFTGAPPMTQMLVGCLDAGMMCAGGFVLAAVPLAGVLYVLAIAAGTLFALLQGHAPVYLGLTALLAMYVAVVIININWNGFLFIGHFLAEARIEQEVAAREQAQAQSAHAERMTALGALAGGIAHDFNNTLQTVAGNAEMIGRRLDNPAEVQRLAQMVLEAAERGGAISRRLLAFARRDSLAPEPVDPVALLTDTRELLHGALGPAILVRAEIPPDPPWLLANRRQLETVLLNLATNARDAMANGGTVTLAAEGCAVGDADGPPGLKPGRYVRLSVSDTGSGMDAATLARAAEPFFTTKPAGKGTGFGLSMAKGFADQSGGSLIIESAPGRGTVVSLWLPRTRRAAAAVASAPAQAGVRRHVLVVDDDRMVRDVIVVTLREAGFIVTGAGNGSEALRHLDSGAPVDAIVTDFAMPDLNGIELVRAAWERDPVLPSILLTGHVGDLEAVVAESLPRLTLVRKPIRPALLVRILAETLG